MTVQLIDRYLQLIDVSKHELQLIGSAGKERIERSLENRVLHSGRTICHSLFFSVVDRM